MPTQAAARSQVRSLIDDLDNPPSKSVRQEDLRRSALGDQVDGTNKFFQLNNRRIVAGSLVVISDGATLTPVTDYAEDDVRGTFTIAGGHAAPATTLKARYDFIYFQDAELDPFITEGLRFVGLTDITTIADGLVAAVTAYASMVAFRALAARNAPIYDAEAGGKKLSKASIKKHWMDLAKLAEVSANDAKTNFYQRQGRRDAPSFGQTNTGQREYTPQR